jgi:hypothetical protein
MRFGLLALTVVFITLLGVWMPTFSWMRARGYGSTLQYFVGGLLISAAVATFGVLLSHSLLYLLNLKEHAEGFVVLVYALVGALGGVGYRFVAVPRPRVQAPGGRRG